MKLQLSMCTDLLSDSELLEDKSSFKKSFLYLLTICITDSIVPHPWEVFPYMVSRMKESQLEIH